MIDILAAFGLSSSAGFNAYLPILITGLLARYTDLLTLAEPWDALEEPWVLLVIAVLLLVEITADKIPIVDTLNDVVQSLVRPAAGAVLFAASSNAISDLNTGLALVFGLLVAGGVHTAKTVARPVITATTAGAGNAVVSAGEDTVAALVAVAAIVVPVVSAVFVVLVVSMLVWLIVRRRRSRTDRPNS
ncbi:MAG: DUF4126 domain-containing protein [Acidimicrobiia bacterium]|nr:DUF4126 domain-containing protein [Acidimicrobiia bacterium]